MNSAEMNLQLATSWMTLIGLFILVFMGPFGSLCNIFIFTSKELKKNSFALYFLGTAMFELPTLCFGIISRLATEHFGSMLLIQSRAFCKVRSYLITAMATVATYFVLLAFIDRCMATSMYARFRAFSQIKVAYRVAIGIIIIGMTVNIHALIFFDIQPTCIPQPGVYALFYSIYLIVWTGILPNAFILIFSIWTVINAKQSRLRIVPHAVITTSQQRRIRKTETQLVVMMLAQAFSSFIIDLTWVSCYSYYFLTANTLKSNYAQLVAVFIFQLGNILLYVNYTKSFYIYTLTSSLYRKIFCTTIQRYYRKLLKIRRDDSGQYIHSSNVGQPIRKTTVIQYELQQRFINDKQ